LMGHAAVDVNGRVRRYGGDIGQTGLDQAMRQRIDDESQHAGHDQRAKDKVDKGEYIENDLAQPKHDLS